MTFSTDAVRELRVRDQVVKEVAVQIQRARLQRGQAVEPGVHRLLAAVAEADVRVADDEDLSRCDQLLAALSSTRSKTAYSSAPKRQNTARCSERARAR